MCSCSWLGLISVVLTFGFSPTSLPQIISLFSFAVVLFPLSTHSPSSRHSFQLAVFASSEVFTLSPLCVLSGALLSPAFSLCLRLVCFLSPSPVLAPVLAPAPCPCPCPCPLPSRSLLFQVLTSTWAQPRSAGMIPSFDTSTSLIFRARFLEFFFRSLGALLSGSLAGPGGGVAVYSRGGPRGRALCVPALFCRASRGRGSPGGHARGRGAGHG